MNLPSQSQASAALDAVAVTPAPQFVFRLDRKGRVIDFEAALALDSFGAATPVCGHDIHRCMHPQCRSQDCTLRLCLHEALIRVERMRIVEWEQADGVPGRTVRMNLRLAPEWASTWATLTVTDITEGRKSSSALREVNRLLTEMNQRSELGQVAEVNRLDRKLRTLTADLIVAQEKERRRIASELHDGVGQWLSMAKLSLESALHRYGTEVARQDAERAFANLTSGIGEVRAIVRNLGPSMLEQFGLVPTVELICHELQLTRPVLQVTFNVEGSPGRISVPLQIAVVRILQEATNNSVKHSEATQLDVLLRFLESKLVLTVADNGRGFSVERVAGGPGRGHGLVSMRERVADTGGQIRIVSRPGSGTRIQVGWDRKTADPAASGVYKAIQDGVGSDGGGAL